MKYDLCDRSRRRFLPAPSAAVSHAAREGTKVLQFGDKADFFGGAAGNCYVNPFMGYTTKIDGKTTLLSDGIFTGFWIVSRKKAD